MIDSWLLWVTAGLALAALFGVLQLQRRQRELPGQLPLLARVVESVRGKVALLKRPGV